MTQQPPIWIWLMILSLLATLTYSLQLLVHLFLSLSLVLSFILLFHWLSYLFKLWLSSSCCSAKCIASASFVAFIFLPPLIFPTSASSSPDHSFYHFLVTVELWFFNSPPPLSPLILQCSRHSSAAQKSSHWLHCYTHTHTHTHFLERMKEWKRRSFLKWNEMKCWHEGEVLLFSSEQQ